MANSILTYNLSEQLDGATTARVDIHAGDGNLTIDRLAGGWQALASGALQYFEKQGQPARTLASESGQAVLTLKGGRAARPWVRLPWAPCNGATEWQIHLNPAVSYDITARADGGNITLDLAGMSATRVAADTGGGNVDVILPEGALSVTARTGAGNVTVCVPGGVAARILVTTGLGKAIVDPRFTQIDGDTYQSPDYEGAVRKVEIMMHSGAGNVVVNSK